MSRLRDRKHRRDSYHRRAKDEGYAARSVYKLQEMDRRFRLFKPGRRVLDLGCRPGSWLQYACEKVGDGGHVVGLDRQELSGHVPSNATVVVGDVHQVELDRLMEALPERTRGCFHLVLSDMAPDTTGIAFTDQARSMELFLRALKIARALGCPGSGSFVAKIFMGEGFSEALSQVKESFERVKTVRPGATRKSSTEQYVVGLGLRSPQQ